MNTERAYASDWRDYAAWCDTRRLVALPGAPETIVLYLESLDAAGRRASTIRRRLAAIASVHSAHGYRSPTKDPLVRDVLATIARAQTMADDAKAPILPGDLRRMLRALPDAVVGARDRALLSIGFATGLRRAELVALDVEDLGFAPEGLMVDLRRQSDVRSQLLIGENDIPEVDVAGAARDWLETAKIETGPLFRAVRRNGTVATTRLSDRAVADIVKRAAEQAGLDASRFSSHSLRSGGRVSRWLEMR